MKHSVQVLSTGVLLLIAAIATDLVGAQYQLLALLILSFVLAVAGAVVAVRGMFEFFGDRAA